MQLLAFDHEGASNCVFDKEGLVRNVREVFNPEERSQLKKINSSFPKFWGLSTLMSSNFNPLFILNLEFIKIASAYSKYAR
jgi:hypothetical protein